MNLNAKQNASNNLISICAYKIVAILSIIVFTFTFLSSVASADTNPATILEPANNQYLELRATSIVDKGAEGKQVIMQLWAHHLNFKGFNVRFEFDNTVFQTSNLSTNVVTTNPSQYFSFEPNFANSLEFVDVDSNDSDNIINGLVSIKSSASPNVNVVNDDNGTYVTTNDGDVMLGQMSFKMTSTEFDMTSFKLKEGNQSPTTGIKVDISILESYQNQKVFRFSDQTASKDATLSNLYLSRDTVDDEGHPITAYYTFDEPFNKETLVYHLTLTDPVDKLFVTAVKSDPKATMKVKWPSRDEDDKVMYEVDGVSIMYDEDDIESDVRKELPINKLGEPDTVIAIKVTAEDGKTKKQYNVIIHRPYGIIRGKVQLGNSLAESMSASYGITLKHNADIKAYSEGEFNFEGIVGGATSYDELDLLTPASTAESDDLGDYSMYVLPGEYDIEFSRPGFLDHVVKKVTIEEGETVNLDTKVLVEGDTNRSGIIDLDDIVDVVTYSGATDGDGVYKTCYDFGQKGFVSLDDVVSVNTNMYEEINIEEYHK